MKRIPLILSFLVILFACSPAEKNVSTEKSNDAPPIQKQETSDVSISKTADQSVNKSEESVFKESEVKDVMGTYVGIDVCMTSSQRRRYDEAMKEVWSLLDEIHWRMSTYSDKGDVYDLNHAGIGNVHIYEDTYYILEQAQYFHDMSEGAFDVTVTPLIDFWKSSAQKNEFPLSREIKIVKEKVGMDHLSLEGNGVVKVLTEGVAVDLGGIAKGYAIDQSKVILQKHGFKHFLIDAGGDVFVSGLNCNQKSWHIGVRHPHNPTGLYAVVEVSGNAVTTSGDYEQFFEIGGQRFSHIINPITGYPQKGVISATVIAPTALEADALSTALSVLGPDKGTALINDLGQGYASLILMQGEEKQNIQEVMSADFPKYKVKK